MKAFSIDTDKFKQNFELMLEKLKQYEPDGATATVQNNATNNNPQMKGENKMDLAKFTEILSDIKCDGNKEACKYRLLNVTDSKVFALDMENYKPYGFDYAATRENDTENIVIDFESKVEMSLSAAEKITEDGFEEFSIQSEIDTVKEAYSQKNVDENTKKISESLSAEFKKDYDELKEAYDALEKSHKIISEKLAVFEKKEAEMKEEAHKAEIDSLINSYAEKLGKYSKFLVYKAQIEDHYSKSVEEVEQDLILMAGKYLTSNEHQAKRNFSYDPVVAGVADRKNESFGNKYGHLLDKYIK